jgi:hypothetical protein
MWAAIAYSGSGAVRVRENRKKTTDEAVDNSGRSNTTIQVAELSRSFLRLTNLYGGVLERVKSCSLMGSRRSYKRHAWSYVHFDKLLIECIT